MTDAQRPALPEPADQELARLRRLAIVDQLLTTLVGVLDVREVFAQVSEVAGRVLTHDGIDLLTDPSAFESVDDQQSDGNRDRHRGAMEFRSSLRIPIRSQGEVIAVLVVQSRRPSAYRPADAVVAHRIADYVALALSYQRLADRARAAEELRARTATLELLDELLTTLTDTGDLPDVFDRVSAVARKVLPHDTLLLIVGLPGGRRAKLYASSGTGVTPFPDEYDIPPAIVADRDWDAEVIDDLSAHPIWRHEEGAKRGYHSCIEMAIRLDGELVAVLAFVSFARGLYKEADLLVARRIRDRLALTLTRGRGLEATRRAEEASARATQLEMRVRALTEELDARSGYRRVVGGSPAWRRALTQAAQVAATETTVLLLGESGTGKEVVARFIHRASARRDGPFVAVNCAALPEQLLEAELFGYERGAFTGAAQSKPGHLEQAAGGVLFLDEVAEMSVSAQAKFLRVLQEREFQRLGSTRVLKTDARFVAATNRDLQKAMERGQFREDLYYRLNVFAIRLPPLRERREDVLPLAEAFIQEIGRSVGRPPAGIAREARQMLEDYHWPGNVRELRNILERAAILCDGGLIATEHLALGPPPAPIARPSQVLQPTSSAGDLKAVERALIVKAMDDTHSNKSEAAKVLGLTRAQLYVRLRKHGLDRHLPKSK